MGVTGAAQIRLHSPRAAEATVTSWSLPAFVSPMRSATIMRATGDDVLIQPRVASALNIQNNDKVQIDLTEVGDSFALTVKIVDTLKRLVCSQNGRKSPLMDMIAPSPSSQVVSLLFRPKKCGPVSESQYQKVQLLCALVEQAATIQMVPLAMAFASPKAKTPAATHLVKSSSEVLDMVPTEASTRLLSGKFWC